jgi:hypothetical protein
MNFITNQYTVFEDPSNFYILMCGPFSCEKRTLMGMNQPGHRNRWPEPYITNSFYDCMKPMYDKMQKRV